MINTSTVGPHGLILSQLIYIVPICDGTSLKYKHNLQVLMNNTARWVSNKGKRTSKTKLMKTLGWLDINKLINYHLLTQIWKVTKL